MYLTEEEDRISTATAEKVIATLEARGYRLTPPVETYPQRMGIKLVAERKGVEVSTVRSNWKKWGLRKIGRDSHGFIFCGTSVMLHIERNSA